MAYIARKIKPPKEATTAAGGLVTFEKFYEMADESVKMDLLDGQVIRDSPGVPKHGDLIGWIVSLIRGFVGWFKLGKVYVATTTVKLTPYQSPEPDVFFVSKKRQGIIAEGYVDGPPDLCVEVISKTSRKRDRGRKFVLYADHGVKEYWIVDPPFDTVEFFENQGGEWKGILPDDKGRLHSKVLPGFWFDPRWIRDLPLPRIRKVIDEIIGKESR